MDPLERLVAELFASAESDFSLEPAAIVAQIEAVCLPALRSADSTVKDLHAVLLFQSDAPPNALQYLITTLQSKDRAVIRGKVVLLKLVAEYVKESGDRIEAYVKGIFDVCWDVFRREVGSNEVKAACLRPMNVILRRRFESLTASTLNVAAKLDWLLEEMRFKKPTMTTKSEILKVIGLLVECYPLEDAVLAKGNDIVEMCHNLLAANFSKKATKPELGTIAGAFSCLDRCLGHFEEKYTDPLSDSTKELFRFVMTAIVSIHSDNLHRYAVPQKALRLLKHHASLFCSLIGSDARTMYTRMADCMRSETPNVKKHAEAATEAVFSQIGIFFAKEARPGRNIADLAVNLINDLLATLNRPEPDHPDLLLALKALACLGPAIGIACQADATIAASFGAQGNSSSNMIRRLIERCEYMTATMNGVRVVSGMVKDSDVVVARKAEYLLALSSLVEHSPAPILEDTVRFLGAMSVDCFVGYPRLFSRQKALIVRALCSTMWALAPRPNLLQQFLEITMQPWLARTISRLEPTERLPAPLINPDTDTPDVRLYFAYVPLWTELIQPQQPVLLQRIQDKQHYFAAVVIPLCHDLLRCVLQVSQSLQLGYSRAMIESEEGVTESLVPAVPMDQELFLNMVSFLEYLFPTLPPEVVKSWLALLFRDFITLSNEYPMVSATYRMLRNVIVSAKSTGIFERWEDLQVKQETPMELTGEEDIVAVLRSFVRQVVIMSSQFHDELLAAVISMVLACPVVVVPISELLDGLLLGLETGLSYIPLASISLDALESWVDAHLENVAPFLDKILPLLDPYLSTAVLESSTGTDSRRRRKRPGKTDAGANIKADVDAVRELQHRIVRLLGRLGAHNRHILVAADKALAELLSWETGAKIEVPLVLARSQVQLSIGSFLPRILQLCEQTTDRQLKLLACESLHSYTVYMVGLAATDPARGGGKDSQFVKSYQKIFPVVIRLAVSVESMSRQLFHKLLFQLIHWFSGRNQVHIDEACALLDALVDGICDASNGSMRELCANGLLEFLRYAIKQTTKGEMASDPLSVDALINRVLNLASHPDRLKRLGAAQAVKKMYRDFREETALVARYGLQLLHTMLLSLRHAHNDHESFGTAASTSECIDKLLHAMRTVVLRGDRAGLLRSSFDRPFPHSLEDLVKWVWRHCSAKEMKFRRKCMQCMVVLSPLLSSTSGGSSSSDALSPARGVVARFMAEQDGGVTHVVEEQLREFGSSLPRDDQGALRWCETLGGVLDCYLWQLQSELCEPGAVFDALVCDVASSSSKKRKVADRSSVSSLVPDALASFSRITEAASWEAAVSDLVRGRMQHARAEVLRRALALLTHCLGVERDLGARFEEVGLLNQPLFEMILTALMRPTTGGLFPSPTHSKETELYLPSAISRFLAKLRELHLAENTFAAASAHLTHKYGWTSLTPLSTSVDVATSITRSYSILSSSGWLDVVLGQSSSELRDLLHSIVEQLSDAPADLNAEGVEAYKAYLELCITLGYPVLPASRTDGRSLLASIDRHSSPEQPSPLYIRFADVVHLAITGPGGKHWLVRGADLVQHCLQHRNLLPVLRGVLRFIWKQRATVSDQVRQSVVTILNQQIEQLQRWFEQPATQTLAMELMVTTLDLLAKLKNRQEYGAILEKGAAFICRTLQESNDAGPIQLALELVPFYLEGTTVSAPLKVETSSGAASSASNEVTGVLVGRIVESLDEMIARHFPLQSNDVDVRTDRGKLYLTLLRKYLEVFAGSGCLAMVNPMIPLLREGTAHNQWNWIRNAIERFVGAVNTTDKLGAAVLAVAKHCLKLLLDEDMEFEVKRIAIDMICVPLIKRTPNGILTTLFTSSDLQVEQSTGAKAVVKQLVDVVSGNLDVTGPEEVWETEMLVHGCCFMLLEVMYDSLELDVLRGLMTRIYTGAATVSGSELTQAICKAAHKGCRFRSPSANANAVRVVQRYTSSAFNCLAIVVAKTQTDERFYNRFVFADTPQAPLWDCIVDTQVKYDLQVETERFRTVYLGARASVPTHANSAAASTSGLLSQYLDSAILSQSSLAAAGVEPKVEFVTEQLDRVSREDEFNPVRWELPPDDDEKTEQEGAPGDGSPGAGGAGAAAGIDDRAIALELNDLNKQPCMKSLLRVIERMSTLFAGTWQPGVMPVWLSSIRDKLASTTTHVNVRLFMLQLLINEPVSTIVKSWADQLLPAVLDFASTTLADPSIGQGFHYVYRELCSLFTMPWADTRPDAFSSGAASRFISHLLSVCYHPTTVILKQNTKEIRTLLKLWCSQDTDLRIDITPVIDLLRVAPGVTGGAHAAPESAGSQARAQRLTGLNLVASLLEVKYPLMSDASPGVSLLCDSLVDTLNFPRKEVFALAGEACGMAMHAVLELRSPHPRGLALEQDVMACVMTMFNKQKYEQFVSCLRGIVQHHGSFLTRDLLLRVFSVFATLKSSSKASVLAATYDAHLAADVDLLQYLSPHLSVLLSDVSTVYQDGEWIPLTQLYTLKLLNQQLLQLTPQLLQHVLLPNGSSTHVSLLSLLNASMHPLCREETYTFLMRVYSEHPALQGNRGDAERLRTAVKISLLKGTADSGDEGLLKALNQFAREAQPTGEGRAHPSGVGSGGGPADPEPAAHGLQLKTTLLKFFQEQFGLSDDPVTRLSSVLQELYDPSCAKQWLHFSTYIMLSLTFQTPEFSRQLFTRSLGDVTFTDMHLVDTTARLAARPMTPMFSLERSQLTQQLASQRASQDQLGTFSTDVAERAPGLLRATQEFGWTQTQDVFGGLPGYAPTQDVVSDREGVVFNVGSTETRTSMPPPAGRPGAKVIQQRGTMYFASQPATQTQQAQAGGAQATQPTSRTLKAGVNVREMQLKRAFNKYVQDREQRRRRVVLYRKYREGELPDIQIPLSDLLLPLVALALSDAGIAKTMFVGLFENVYQLDDAEPMRPTYREQVQRVMDSSKQQTDLVSALLSSCEFAAKQDFNADDIDGLHSIQPEVVTEAALRSLNFHGGIALLEHQLQYQQQYLQRHEEQYDVEAFQQNIWLQLSRLYSALNERDLLIGVCTRASKVERTRAALDAELRGDYRQAILIYNELLDEHDQNGGQADVFPEVDSWIMRSMEALRNLLDWEQLHTACLNAVGDDPEKLWSPANRERFLPYFVQSLVNSDNFEAELTDFLEEIMSGQNDASNQGSQEVKEEDVPYLSKREWLEQEMPLELAVAYLARREIGRVSGHVNTARARFLESWSALSVCATAAKKLQLQSLQRLTELEDVVMFFSKPSNITNSAQIEKLFARWSKMLPSEQEDPVTVWYDSVRVRSMTTSLLMNQQQKQAASSTTGAVDVDLFRRLDAHLATFHLHAAAAAIEQGIMVVAQNHIRTCSQLLQHVNESTVSMKQVEVVLRYNEKMLHSETDNAKIASIFGKSKELLRQRLSDTESLSLTDRLLLQQLDAHWAAEHGKFLQFTQKKRREATAETERALAAYQALVQLAQEHRAATVSAEVQHDPTAMRTVQVVSAAFEKYARFCDTVVAARESTKAGGDSTTVDIPSQSTVDMARNAIMGYTRAMTFGSEAARDKIPRIMQLVGGYGERCADKFNQLRGEIPAWFYLKWVSQLMALLDRPEGEVVASILTDLADVYPRALSYPFKITSENLGEQGQRLTGMLRMKLHDPAVEAFIEALACLHHPELRWSDGLKQIKKLLQQRRTAEAKERYEQLHADVLSLEHPYIGDKIGSYNREFAQKLRKQADKLVGEHGEKLSAETLKKLEAGDMKPQSEARPALSRFSEWLAEFDTSRYTLEVPGQYSGLTRPDPSRHVMITGFHPSLLVMSSLRKPKRLKIRGSDEKEHMFLVKGGEDLRSDERIEQMLDIMNAILDRDPLCKQAGLRSRTYKVVPMSSKIGVLEWVDNTAPVKALLEEQLSTDEQFKAENKITGKVDLGAIKARRLYLQWMKETSPQKYHEMYKGAPAAATRKLYQQMVRLVPSGVLQQRLASMASSAEAVISIRSEFARSLAVSCIACYLLGIGDRHLDNFLIDMSSGSIVLIDFGMTFGLATSVLPVPELIPFRLTRQFLDVLQPLDSVGLLRHHMIRVMAALRESRDVLENALEVYLNEPVLDWVSGVIDKGMLEEQREDLTWEPRRKINNAIGKLCGRHPVELMLDDLRLNPAVKSYGSFDKLKQVVQGDAAAGAQRCRAQQGSLDVATQVDYLIELATDPNVLTRQWVGLSTWV